MILRAEQTSVVVFHVLSNKLVCAALDKYPFPTPVFYIRRTVVGKESTYRVDLELDIGFNCTILSRTDVLRYIVEAPGHIRTDTVQEVRQSVTALLNHWSDVFPVGVPNNANY